MLVTLSLFLILINSINGQIHLERSNLAQMCNCDINSTVIDLRSKGIVSIDSNAFQGLSKLKYLYLYGNELSSIDNTTFQGLSNLLELYLNFNQLSSIGTNTFQGLSKLKRF